MEKSYTEQIKIKVDKENNVGTLSIRVNEFKVEVYKMSLQDLQAFVNTAYNEVNK